MLGRSALVQSALAVTMLLVSTRVARAGETIEGCCLANGSCANLANADCLQQSGVPQPGVTCNGASCGACCSVGAQPGLACTLALASNCTAAQQRAFAGPGTDCDNGCPFCCSCHGDVDCSNACTDDTPTCGICQPGCVTSVALFDDCQDGCATTGCCETGGDASNQCADTNAAACALFEGGTFHPGQVCNPGLGCTPPLCCRCEGDSASCGSGQCRDSCLSLICRLDQCTGVVTTGTCDGGCKPTGCCNIGRGTCLASDQEACEVVGGMFLLGGTCDPPTGQCSVAGPSPTPTVTPTVTVTATASATAAPTSTRVPEGGSCTETSQCAPLLVCIDNICTAVNAPAPTTSRFGLVVVLAALLAIAAVSLRRLVAGRR